MSGDRAQSFYQQLRGRLSALQTNDNEITQADEFSYVDPVDHSRAEQQGLRFSFNGGGRIVVRLSGTGTAGTTVRVYYEQFSINAAQVPQQMLSSLIRYVDQTLSLPFGLGRNLPSVVS